MSHTPALTSETPRTYSTLEHNPGPFAEELPGNNAETYQEHASVAPEVVTKSAYYANHDNTSSPYNKTRYGYYGAETGVETGVYTSGSESIPQEKQAQARICGMRARIFWIMTGLVLGLIVLGAVLGGALGATLGKQGQTANSNPSATTTTVSGPYPTSTPQGYTGVRDNSRIAAASYIDRNNALTYVVYYQDENNIIKESEYNTTTNTWTVNAIPYLSLGAKPGSAIGAATSRMGIRQGQKNVFYFDTDNKIHEVYTDTFHAGKWLSGQSDAQNYTAHPDSHLAAVFDDTCTLCTQNLLWYWQDPQNNIRVGNSSGTQLSSATILPSLPGGSPFSVSAFPIPNQPQNWRFFHRTAQNLLAYLEWTSFAVTDLTNSTGQGWSAPQILGAMTSAAGASIASCTWQLTAQGFPRQQHVFNTVNSGDMGLNVTAFDGNAQAGKGAWVGASVPEVFKNVGSAARVAANVDNQVFVLTKEGKISQYTVGDDGGVWRKVGEVPTK